MVMPGLMRVMVAVQGNVLFNLSAGRLIEKVMDPMGRCRGDEKEKGKGKQKAACALPASFGRITA
jgi:hypothetical protein